MKFQYPKPRVGQVWYCKDRRRENARDRWLRIEFISADGYCRCGVYSPDLESRMTFVLTRRFTLGNYRLVREVGEVMPPVEWVREQIRIQSEESHG